MSKAKRYENGKTCGRGKHKWVYVKSKKGYRKCSVCWAINTSVDTKKSANDNWNV